jgi:hypothetical protein
MQHESAVIATAQRREESLSESADFLHLGRSIPSFRTRQQASELRRHRYGERSYSRAALHTRRLKFPGFDRAASAAADYRTSPRKLQFRVPDELQSIAPAEFSSRPCVFVDDENSVAEYAPRTKPQARDLDFRGRRTPPNFQRNDVSSD